MAFYHDRIVPHLVHQGMRQPTLAGCHLNREMDRLIADAGFRIETLETGYMPGPRVMTFLYEGAALRA